MKTITESEAQQLANLLGMPITQDITGCKSWVHGINLGYAEHFAQWFGFLPMEFPIRIASDRPWTEQIWKPESV